MALATRPAPYRGRYAGIAVSLFAVAVGVLSLAIARQDPEGSLGGVSIPAGIAELAGGWSLAFVGLIYWTRRRRNRFGPLLAAAGFAWFLPEWANPDVGNGLAFSIGLIGVSACAPLVGHAALAYPSGRLTSNTDRALLTMAYAGALVLLGFLPTAVFDPPAQGCFDCPKNVILVQGNESLYDTFNRWGLRVGLAWTLLLVFLMAWRFFRARSVLAVVGPVLGPAVAFLLLVSWEFRHSLDRGFLSNSSFDQRVWRYEAAALLVLALGVAWGLLRERRARASVARLVVDLGQSPRPGGVREALADALRDPSLELAYVRERGGGYIGADGRPVGIEAGPTRAVTPLMREGRSFAVLVHSAMLLDDRTLVEEVLSAARLAVENERLQAEVRAQLIDLRASRARIVETGDAERRRLERDLHDGAQQRIVGLALALQLLKSQLGAVADPELAGRIGDAETGVRGALAELRELAHGIHPAVLSDEGLAAAVETLAEQSPVRIEIGAIPDERLPLPVEAAAYFAIAEAIKSAPGRATVNVARENGLVVVIIRHSGDKDSDPEADAQLLEIADRVGALDGRLDVQRDRGETVVRAEIPCA
jgi:signal transduction histidine kinase